MKIYYDIEYDIIDDKVTFDRSEFIEYGDVIVVRFEAFPTWEEGDEDVGTLDVITLERYGNPTWDKDKHTDIENSVIEQFIDSKKYKELEELFIDNYYEEYPTPKWERNRRI